MADIFCAKCGEPWDAYGVKHGDMGREEGERFNRGEGCPCCGFGSACPSCDGTGRDDYRDPHTRCPSCRDKGYVLGWEPHRQTGLSSYKVGHVYTGYVPNVREITDPGFDAPLKLGTRTFPEKIGSHMTRDGYVTEWWIPCPEGCATQAADPCPSCEGTGKLTVEDPEGLAFEAAKSACNASDEDPIGILADRGF